MPKMHVTLDPLQYLVLTADLTAEEERGLIRLFLAAAASGTGEVPADDVYLAALSGLGENWQSSRLLASIERWADFLDLASGAKYRFRDISTQCHMAHSIAPERSPGDAPGTKRCNSIADTALRPESTPKTEEVFPESDSGTCYPPHTPPYRENAPSSIFSSRREEKCAPEVEQKKEAGAPRCSGGVEGAGRRGGHEFEQRTMWPEEAPTAPKAKARKPRKAKAARKPRVCKRVKITRDHEKAAHRLVCEYQDQVDTLHRRYARGQQNVAWWLAKGITEESIRAAIKHYADHCDRHYVEPIYRYGPMSFFGRQDPIWQGWLQPEKPQERNHVRPKREDPSEQLERILREAGMV